MKLLLVKILDYLKYPSTIKGLVGLAGALGVVVSPEHLEAITAAVIGVVGLVQVFIDDTKLDKSAK